MKQTSVLFLFVLFGLALTVAKGDARSRFYEELSKTSSDGSYRRMITMESIIEVRKRRKHELEHMVHSMKRKLEDHTMGIIELNPNEIQRIEYRVGLYQQRLDSVNAEIGEQELKHMLYDEAPTRAPPEENLIILSGTKVIVYNEIPMDALLYEL